MIVLELIMFIIGHIVFIFISILAIYIILLMISHKDYYWILPTIFLEVCLIMVFLDTFYLNGAMGRAVMSFLETEI